MKLCEDDSNDYTTATKTPAHVGEEVWLFKIFGANEDFTQRKHSNNYSLRQTIFITMKY